MSTNDARIDALLEAINKDIAEREEIAASAMLTLEQMNTSPKDYEDACHQFGANLFVAGYLRHIKDVVETRDIKSAENIIRFHAYHQETKGAMDDGRDVSLGQAAVTVILKKYVDEFFEC